MFYYNAFFKTQFQIQLYIKNSQHEIMK
jgi:hypothetical protein